MKILLIALVLSIMFLQSCGKHSKTHAIRLDDEAAINEAMTNVKTCYTDFYCVGIGYRCTDRTSICKVDALNNH